MESAYPWECIYTATTNTMFNEFNECLAWRIGLQITYNFKIMMTIGFERFSVWNWRVTIILRLGFVEQFNKQW